MDIHYNCVPSLRGFHRSNAKVRIVRGPVGSGKTTAMFMELLRVASAQAPDPFDGIRRTRMVITRNTLTQLRSTCLVSIMNFLRPIARWKPSDNVVLIDFGDVQSEWMLLPLDTPQNVQRLLSLEVTMVWASEARELDPKLITEDALSRTNRYPSVAHGGCTRSGLIAESNSFRTDSPWYALLEEHRPKSWDYFVQPSALSPEADWIIHHNKGYYEDLIDNNTPEWIAQYIENKYGDSLDGQAVYKNSFVKDLHVAKETLKPRPDLPLVIGMDFARWPACVICQMMPTGQLVVYEEAERENTGVELFAREVLTPMLAQERYRGCSAFIVGDPSGISKSQIGESSTFDTLVKLGFAAYPALTNRVDPRIRAVERFLLARNGLLVDPSCKVLIAGFMGRYRYKYRVNGEMDVIPDKIRPWADVHDALQYACLGTAKQTMTRAVRNFAPVRAAPPLPVGAWT